MLPGYELLEWLGPTGGSRLCRARRLADQKPVLLKLLDAEPTTPDQLARLRREHDLLDSLHLPGVARPLALLTEGRPAIVLEDVPGELLEAALVAPLPVPRALRLGRRIAQALAGLHEAQVIHHDLRPANLLSAFEGDRIEIVDLSRAAPRDDAATRPDGDAARDLAYISPEQTGRMHRSVDHRTDLYSLGVILYRMFAGAHPFEASDPLEWVHCHLARMPTALTEVVPELPRAVSDIVMRLLAKPPEERYQSARGLEIDLAACLTQWEASGRIEPFPLGADDIADRIQIPKKLYGRERELAELLQAYRRVAAEGAAERVLVSGHSGVGKSTLVHELEKRITRDGGIVISGKFDQYKSDIPYATFAQAFRALVQQILAGSEEEVEAWRRRLREALGSNAQVIVAILPELELIIGKQPPVPVVGALEAQNRFQATFHRFLGVFPRAERPVALFLDDLQWADSASLALLDELLTHSDMHHVLVIGAYRDKGLGPSHPLTLVLDGVRKEGTHIRDVVLAPLTPEELGQLVADTFRCSPETAAPLARLVYEKTGGDPFFATQFLTALQQDRLIELVPSGGWRWDVHRIATRDYTDNVVELMLDKLRRLPEKTRTIMTLAACIGSNVNVSTLALISERTEDVVHEALWVSVREGLMLRTNGSYRFLHDRIRQAAYSLIPEDRRAALHLTLGRRLLAHASPEEREAGPFEIANHFMLGVSRIEDPEERAEVARLLLVCGRKAKASTAHAAAEGFFSTAMSLLDAESWTDRYELTYEIHLERADCEWLIGNFDEAERLLVILLSRAHATVEKFAVYGIQVRIHTIRGDVGRSIDSGLRALRLIGFDVPVHPSPEQAKQAHDAVWKLLEGRSIESLIDLPPATNPEIKAASALASRMIDAVTFYDANLNLLLSSFMVSTSLRYGHTESSSVGYAAFAMVLGFDRRAEAYRFGKLAYDLDERLGSKINEVKIATFVAGTLNPWNKPYKSGLAHLDGAARAGAENGDFLWASYSLFNLVWLLFMAGEPLADLNYESENRLALVRAMKADDTACSIVVLQRCISNLRGITADSSTYDGDGGGEAAFEEIMDRERIPTFVCMRNIWKMQVRFVLGHHDAALAASAKAKATLWAVYRLGILPEFHYYDALLRAALYRDVSPSQQEEYMATLVAHEKALRTWAEGCPENFAAKHALVSAEIARIGGREMAAGRSYEQAVRLARQYGLVQNEAIANETAARFYRAQGLDSIATMYLREARACYARWGADGKVKQLELQSPHLFEPSPVAATTAQGTPVATPGIHAEQLDLLTVIKASQAISREIVLGDLLETLMRVVLESAGAQTASLMLARGGELTLAAVASVDQHGVSVRRREGEALSSSELPLSILNYVRRSRKQVLLENANQPNPFAADESLVQRQPKSILCLPILRQAELIGILYLENNLVTNAFTPDRLAVLELLAGQAAISLEIASLIETEQRAREAMARSESRFRRIFESNMIGLIFGDLTGAIKQANDYMLDMLGYTRDDLDSGGLRWTEMTPPEWRAASANAVAELRSSGVCRPFEKEYIRKDGSRVPALLGSSILPGTHDEMLTFVLDITDRKRAEASLRRSEEHLRQAQKMDAIGNLAGGIAHDFNNLLSVILSYSGMLARRMSPDDPRRAQLEEIEGAGKRAAELTHQLLAFGRKQVLQPTVVNLSEILTGVEPMLRRLIGEDIELIVRAAPTLGEVKADRGQIEQIVMNLTVNGRDAMPQGGRLTLETANADLDDAYAAEHAGVVAGPHVMLAVTDTGIGMDEATQARMFEPFFTTKEKGKGTGLGLATVFGIVQQSGGNVSVSSEPGKGATFKIHFPRTDAVAAGVHESVAPEPAPMVGTETILLVEDDVRVRALARTILQGCGYLVVEARSGGDALRVCEEHPAIIHLLLTDVIMPRMSGPQLAERLRASHPEMKVLFMSGYTDDSIVHRGVLKPGVAFLQKPITPETLTRKVREALDAARTDPSHI